MVNRAARVARFKRLLDAGVLARHAVREFDEIEEAIAPAHLVGEVLLEALRKGGPFVADSPQAIGRVP